MPDSYDQIARSIEVALRREVPPPASPQQLAGSIDRIMAEEAIAGASRIARFRLLMLGPFTALALVRLLRRDPADPLATPREVAELTLALWLAWLAIAVILEWALARGWYRRWVPHVMPAVDAFMIAATFLVPLGIPGGTGGGATPGALAGFVALCAFLGISGGLRLSRSSARISMTLAVAVFVAGAVAAGMVGLDAGRAPLDAAVAALDAAAVVVALIATGQLTAKSTRLVQRLVIDEVAKLTLTQMFNEAKLAIDAREQVLKIVSHDLRNPLQTVAMGASLLLEIELPPEKQREHLARIKRAGERMDRLVRDLLDVAKMDAGRVAIAPREIEVAPLLREAHEMLAPIATEKSIALDLDVADRLPRISADSGRILQVLSNLVGNAVKFTPAGGRIVIRAHPSPGGVQFSVSDTGCGIPPEKLGEIFKRSWQADAADRRGIGLGLAIAKGIVEAHGGRIRVESRVGEGTTFHFVLGGTTPGVPALGGTERRERVTAGG